MQTQSTIPPAGWYPDPNGEQRWWDGTQWGAAAQAPEAVERAKGNNRKALLLAGGLAVAFVVVAAAISAAGGGETKHSAAPVKALDVTTTTTAPPVTTTTAAPAPVTTAPPHVPAPTTVPKAPVTTAPKSATPANLELAFRVLMVSDGFDPDVAVQAGHAVCDALDAGNSLQVVAARSLVILGTGRAEGTGHLLGGAIAAFCPQYQSALDSFAQG